MKVKVSYRAIRENYYKIYAVGYCDMANIERYLPCNFYSAGIYGWNCDYYTVSDTVIVSSGYRTIGKHLDYATVRKYDKEFSELSYDEKCKSALDYLKKIIEESEGKGK